MLVEVRSRYWSANSLGDAESWNTMYDYDMIRPYTAARGGSGGGRGGGVESIQKTKTSCIKFVMTWHDTGSSSCILAVVHFFFS